MVARRFPAGARAAALTLVLVPLVVFGCSPRRETSTTAADSAAVPADTILGSAGPLHVDDGGSGGIPVVFVHAFSGNAGHWAAQLDHLRASRRAVAFDLRGHGGSTAPPDSTGYAVDSLASDIGAVLDGLDLDRVVLVGHSMGGSAAIDYAGEHPERVAGLVLVSTPGKSPAAQAKQVLAAMDADYGKTMDDFWARLLERAKPATKTRIEGEAHAISREASFALIRAIFAYDPTRALKAYPGPKLIVDTEGPDTPGSLHALAPDVPRKVIAGTSHWPQLDQPDEMNALLDEFLKGVQ
jgi:pimeloyl-ACP methyl ester carboxylesterase